MEDPIYDPGIIPTLYSKIGALTVRNDILAARVQDLQAQLSEHEPPKNEREGEQ